jgi:hypothetical protein
LVLHSLPVFHTLAGFSHREKHVDEKSLIFLPATNSARQCKGDACGNLVAEEPIPELDQYVTGTTGTLQFSG